MGTVMRYAVVQGARDESVVEAYLPDNYIIVRELPLPSGWMLMAGEDDRGWTLDGYVAPRMRQWGMAVEEIDAEHALVKEYA